MVFSHRWRERWHLGELWSLQWHCEMIELADSWAWSANSVLSCAESIREVHSVLPFDFPVKSGSCMYYINVGIHLLMCSGKLCYVPDFGDFCSWKCNFGVGMYVCLCHVVNSIMPGVVLFCSHRLRETHLQCWMLLWMPVVNRDEAQASMVFVEFIFKFGQTVMRRGMYPFGTACILVQIAVVMIYLSEFM